MGVVIVGGQARGVGKTSVVCGLIAAMPEKNWTAIKVSAHGHSAGVEVHEEHSAGGETDSARYLAVGAARSFYISVPTGGLWKAVPQLLDLLAESRNALVESTSVLAYLRPELAVAVLGSAASEIKSSLRTWSGRFNAVVVPGGTKLPEIFTGRKRFDCAPPIYVTHELLDYARHKLRV